MSVLHIGTATTLAAIPKADCGNNDVAYIWLNSFQRKMVYNSTSTDATDITNHPYAQRPSDYGAVPGVWEEDIGADQPEVWSADQIVTGQLTSTNWAATAGSQYDLDLAKFRLGGSNVAAAGSAAGIFLGLDSGVYKAYFGDGSNVYWKFDGAHLTISVDANVGTGVGVIYKDGKRWLYDFNPTYGASAQPEGFNTFLGVECGNLTMGAIATSVDHASHNVGVGYQAIYSITNGHKNIGIGTFSLRANTIGYDNVGVGTYTLFDNTEGYSNVAIGNSPLYENVIGYGNIGIGTYALHDVLRMHNIGIGTSAGYLQNDSLTPLTTPEHSIYIGAHAYSGSDPDGGEDAIENEIVIGSSAFGNGTNSFTLGNANIGALHCQAALTIDSDRRIKRNIHPSLLGLSFINALNPITFQPLNPFDYPDKIKPCNYKDRTIKEKDKDGKEKDKLIKADKRPDDNDRTYLGLTAQEVESVMTTQGINLELVSTSNRGKKSITYGNLIMPLITAVQELSQKVTVLESKVN